MKKFVENLLIAILYALVLFCVFDCFMMALKAIIIVPIIILKVLCIIVALAAFIAAIFCSVAFFFSLADLFTAKYRKKKK